MSTTQAANELLNGSGPPAVKFDNKGDVAKGIITDLGTQQARDFESGELKFYDDGNPMMQIVITIQQDGEDEEKRIFVKPQMKTAIREAVNAAGADNGLEVGGVIAVEFFDEEPPKKKGLNPKKLFRAQYQAAPPKTVSKDDLLG